MSATLALESAPVALRSAIGEAIAYARRAHHATLITYVEPLPGPCDPLAFMAASSAALGSGVLWQHASSGHAFAGAGAAVDVRVRGPGRFAAAAAALRAISARLVRAGEAARFPVIGGFAFGDGDAETSRWRAFPDGRLIVPRVLAQSDGASTHLRITCEVDPRHSHPWIESRIVDLLAHARDWARSSLPDSQSGAIQIHEAIPARKAWEASVATAVGRIRQGALDKVVLAREERLHASEPVSPVTTLFRLRAAEPSATLFAMQSASDWFLGATPERLVRLKHGRVDVTCLAGSIGIGSKPNERRRLAERLLASAKDREEHEIVVQATIAALAEVCEDVARLPGTPRVVAARSVQHLETPVSGWLRGAGQVLDLVERLHPTPAVGGYPRDRALSVIRELEQIERGWYAGPFGWTDLDGCGEFAVAIRSALLTGHGVSVFAGGGIVADSIPAEEYAETRLKMRPMLAALGAG